MLHKRKTFQVNVKGFEIDIPLLVLFIFNMIIVIIIFQSYLYERYISDSYAHWSSSWQDIARLHVGGSRFISAIYIFFLGLLNVKDIDIQILNSACLITCISLCITLLTVRIYQEIKNRSLTELVLIEVAVMLFYINTFTAEMAIFPETGFFIGFGHVFTLFAAFHAVKFKIAKHYLLAALFLFLALGIYQSFLGCFTMITLSLIAIDSNMSINRKTISQLAIVFALLSICSILNILTGKILFALMRIEPNIRFATLNIHTILSNIKKVIMFQLVLWNGLNHSILSFLPPLIFSVLVFNLFTCITPNNKLKQDKQNSLLVGLIWILIFCLGYLTLFMPFLFQAAGEIDNRALLGFTGIYLIIVVMTEILSCAKVHKVISLIAVSLMLIANIQTVIRIGTEQIMVNVLDTEYANNVVREIKEYEAANGLLVTRLSICNDAVPLYHYPTIVNFVNGKKLTVTSSRVVEWSWTELIMKQSGVDYTRLVMDPEIYQEHFANMNWDYFVPAEQMVFVDDTLYLSAF